MIARPAPADADVAIEREIEIFPDGRPRTIGTAFLRNGRCPLACVYCALYRQAGDAPVDGPEIAAQIRNARARLPEAKGWKLYNASSLFEPRSIRQSDADLAAIAGSVADLDLVVVEARSEQAARAPAFAREIGGHLEVAIGLEVADDGLLRRLGKPTTIARFCEAAAILRDHDVLLRAFVLVQPPFVRGEDAAALARATFDLAVSAGARVVSLLPVVSEHAPMERLRASGDFREISAQDYFAIVSSCVARGGALVLAVPSALARLPGCETCRGARVAALEELNQTGRLGVVDCPVCERTHRRPAKAQP